jgi:hypothetical protein
MQSLLQTLVGGRLSREPTTSTLADEHQYRGTRDIAALLSVPAAIDFMQERDWPHVRQAFRELVQHA